MCVCVESVVTDTCFVFSPCRVPPKLAKSSKDKVHGGQRTFWDILADKWGRKIWTDHKKDPDSKFHDLTVGGSCVHDMEYVENKAKVIKKGHLTRAKEFVAECKVDPIGKKYPKLHNRYEGLQPEHLYSALMTKAYKSSTGSAGLGCAWDEGIVSESCIKHTVAQTTENHG